MAGAMVAAVCAELDRLAPDGAVGVAVSGGGDSAALLVIAADWARGQGRRIHAATVDHGLRPESAREAASVAALCARLNIPHQILHADGLRSARGNLSAAARDARFELLGAWARAEGLSAVLLGHTMDDQAETVLMRLARGSGAEGLSAMQARLQHAEMLWLRPLLDIRRDALRDVLRDRGIDWIEDPTNEDLEYDRVKARAALTALAPLGIDAEGLARTAARLQRQRRVLERAMVNLAGRARQWGEFGEVRLDLAALAQDEPDTALRLLADSLQRVSGAMYRPRFRSLSEVFDTMLAGSAATLSGCLIRPDGCAALICREPEACAPAGPLGRGVTSWDRRWRVCVAGSMPGPAELGALGEPGLAALRAEADAENWISPDSWSAAPRFVRLTTPAIWIANGAESRELLAVPLAGYANPRRIEPETVVTTENIAAGELP